MLSEIFEAVKAACCLLFWLAMQPWTELDSGGCEA